MSELKVYRDPKEGPCWREFYEKSEADKVIAELKKACNDKDDWCLHTLKENRHHKYKRCMAMASLSLEKRETYRAEYEEWCLKWYKRWLELAEKFKPSNEGK